MRIAQCLGCKLMALLVSDLCTACESRYEKKVRIKQLVCDVCLQTVPLRTILTNNDEVIDICRVCWEDMLEKAGDE